MPTVRRIYAIKDTSTQASPENYVAGEARDAFEDGARLSNDGGSTHTHSAFNCLDDPDNAEHGRLIDRSALFEALGNTPLFDVYGCDDPLGNGTVYRRDSGQWVEVGDGDLEAKVLADAGLERYVTGED